MVPRQWCRHITEARELLSKFTKMNSGIHVGLGDDAKYAVSEEGKFSFQLESGGLFDAQDVLFLARMKKNLLSISVIEDRDFVVVLLYLSKWASTPLSRGS